MGQRVSGFAYMDRFVAKLRSRQALSDADEKLLREARWEQRRFNRHEVIVHAGEPQEHVHLLLSGFAARAQEDSGGSRQLVGIGIPGDLVDIHGAILGRLEQELVALSACEVAMLPHAQVRKLTRDSAAIQMVFWLQAAVDHAIQSAWIQALGTKRGTAKLAHIFCEMQLRLGLVGIATQMGFPMPLSQQELADYSGMTHVHLNRCLKELREAKLLSFAQGWAKVEDWEGLKALARFDEAYLNLRLIEV
jgi:CRP-like cAMP-binding protein